MFKSPDCQSTSSFRHWKKSQITYADKRRAQQSVEAQIAWAEQAKRKDKDDAEWDDAAAQTANPGLDEFELVLEKMERSKTADGRCEKALQRLLHHRGTWAGSTSYRGQSWLWYVQKLLPRYYGHAKAWSTIAMHRPHLQHLLAALGQELRQAAGHVWVGGAQDQRTHGRTAGKVSVRAVGGRGAHPGQVVLRTDRDQTWTRGASRVGRPRVQWLQRE